jgi:hypothetical protein
MVCSVFIYIKSNVSLRVEKSVLDTSRRKSRDTRTDISFKISTPFLQFSLPYLEIKSGARLMFSNHDQ